MKKILATIAALTVVVGVAQAAVGTLAVENYTSGNAVYVNSIAPANLAKGVVQLEIWAGPVGTVLSEANKVFGFTYDMTSDPGFYDMASQALAGTTPNANTQFKMWGWQGGTRPQLSPLSGSVDWTQTVGSWDRGDVNLPPPLVTGPASLAPPLVLIPEPSTIALGLLGLGALLIRRRK